MHRRDLSIVEAPPQRTVEADSSIARRDHMRDAVGDYTAHTRLEATRSGRTQLDLTTDLQLALVGAMEGLTGTEWSSRTGFRSSGDIRKLRSGELIGTMNDVSSLATVDHARFVRFAIRVAELAGLRCEPMTAPARAIHDALAQLGRTEAEVSGQVLNALSPSSPGGGEITPDERMSVRRTLDEHKTSIAEVERNLGGDKA